jgi:starch synthase (maltosyl-transferring)
VPSDKPAELPVSFRRRVAIERVEPDVDGGRFAVKRVVGDVVRIAADIVCDGHDELDCSLHVRHGDTGQWTVVPMTCVGNDRWEASFSVDRIGLWQFTITGRFDPFATWLRDLGRREAAGENLRLELLTGAELVASAAHRASASEARELEQFATALRGTSGAQTAKDPRLGSLMNRHADRRDETRLEPVRTVWADRPKAAFSAWYEVFPRSWGRVPGEHGTFLSLAERLDYVAGLGFDVLYMTPIHPIGMSFRKGKNNSLAPTPNDVGSPWAIGSSEGGHTAIHPKLGTFEDFQKLRSKAESLGMELALDLAIQCAPDHPWVKEHPEWFRKRADGSIRYAENPPKKYQDIVNFDFQCEHWRTLWEALGGVVKFWVDQGVRIFRVDNPHTKPFAFWEWMITDIHRTHPDVLFLSEAFTRPKIKYRLAKLGFTQGYTYFTWRTERDETAAYLEEVTTPPVSDFFRPNFWPNTPDILHESLQKGGRPMFMMRLALAALSVGNWGMYGPAMELLEATPVKEGSEEYLDSEKYEIKTWNLHDPASLAPFVRQLNAIRRAEPALARPTPAAIHPIDDPELLAWSRYDADSGSRVLVVVNMEPSTTRSGLLRLDRESLGLTDSTAVMAHDLLEADAHAWSLAGITVECTPERPVRVFRIEPCETNAHVIAAAIIPWLPEARWFAGKGSSIKEVTVADIVTLPGTDIHLAVVDIATEAVTDRYVTPLYGCSKIDAAAAPAFASWLLDSLTREDETLAVHGRFVGRAVERIFGGTAQRVAHGDTIEVNALGNDASNTSLVVRRGTSEFAIKLFRRCVAGPQPEVEVGRFLTGVVGWHRTPALLGWIEYEPADGGPATVIATLHEFLPGCQSAWDFAGRLLATDTAGALPEPCVALAASLGRLTGEMHTALASHPDNPAFAPEADADAGRLVAADAMPDRVRRGLARAAKGCGHLPAATASRITSLCARADRMAAVCLDTATGGGGGRVRVHGDYHLGQVLVRPDGDLFVIDFEGEPSRTLVDRAAKTSPFKDIAGMCRSFDYLLRHAAITTGRPVKAGEHAALEGAFLAAYRSVVAGESWWPADEAVADRLLAAWKLDKAVYELLYEIDNRPDWIDVPLSALEELSAA